MDHAIKNVHGNGYSEQRFMKGKHESDFNPRRDPLGDGDSSYNSSHRQLLFKE
jgi:hypothetical protein